MARPARNSDPSSRRADILEAARRVLAEKGYAGATMLEIARCARASKETLYAWFGDKQGLFAEVVMVNAAEIQDTLAPALKTPERPTAESLYDFALALLRLQTGERSLTVNRAAISEAPRDSTLAELLKSRGRDRVEPLLARYLLAQRDAGRLTFDEVGEVVDTLVGLVMADLQVRRLLGTLPRPSDDALRQRARRAVAQFLKLYGT